MLCFEYMTFLAVAINNVTETDFFSCMSVSDSGNGLEFIGFVVLVSFLFGY